MHQIADKALLATGRARAFRAPIVHTVNVEGTERGLAAIVRRCATPDAGRFAEAGARHV